MKHQILNSPVAIGRRLKPPISRLQPEGIYHFLNYMAPTRRTLQPPYSQAQTRRKLQLPMFSNTKWKDATNPFPCPIPPPRNISVDQTVTTTITTTVTSIIIVTTIVTVITTFTSTIYQPISINLSLSIYHCQHVIVSNLSLQPVTINLSHQPIIVIDTQHQ
jgi:hypothetical protein